MHHACMDAAQELHFFSSPMVAKLVSPLYLVGEVVVMRGAHGEEGVGWVWV